MLLAASEYTMQLRKGRVNTRVDDVAGNMYQAPPRYVPFQRGVSEQHVAFRRERVLRQLQVHIVIHARTTVGGARCRRPAHCYNHSSELGPGRYYSPRHSTHLNLVSKPKGHPMTWRAMPARPGPLPRPRQRSRRRPMWTPRATEPPRQAGCCPAPSV